MRGGTEIRPCHKCGNGTAMETREGKPLCSMCFDRKPLERFQEEAERRYDARSGPFNEEDC